MTDASGGAFQELPQPTARFERPICLQSRANSGFSSIAKGFELLGRRFAEALSRNGSFEEGG